VRATTAALLRDLGHQVVEAEDATRGLALLVEADGAFDLVITDYAMPRISGTELIVKAREIVPRLPAIIITGYADANQIARKPDDVVVIAKPFTPEEMKHTLQRVSGG
jgi:CheY-like chemotaxis protein